MTPSTFAAILEDRLQHIEDAVALGFLIAHLEQGFHVLGGHED